MKKEILYITEWVSYIKRWENTIVVVKKDETKKVIPIEIIESLYIFTQLSITTWLLEILNKYNIPIYFHGYYWNYTGSFYPREQTTSWAIIVDQVNNFSNDWLWYAKKLMYSAFSNMIKVLNRYNNLVDKEKILRLKEIRNNIDNICSINDLMWLEWIFRQIYYSQFSKCIKNNKFSFNDRNRQPPTDPVNSLMSLLNMCCYNMVNDSIIKSQLSPFISFYHSMNQNRYNLSLDIAEIFKPILVDRLILKLLNNNMLKPSDFTKDKVIWIVKLKEASYKKVMNEWNMTINDNITLKQLWKKYTWKSIVKFECYKIIKYWWEKNNFNFYILND